MHLPIRLSPAMMDLLVMMLTAMMPMGFEARGRLKKFDEHLKEVLGPFDKNDYTAAAEKFVETLEN